MAEAKNVVSPEAVARAVLPTASVNEVSLNALADPTPLPGEVNLNEFVGVVPLKNIRYLGRCYDLRKLDLLDLGAREGDGGGCMATFAVDMPPEKCDVKSPDHSVLIARGTRYRSESRGEKTSSTLVWKSTEEFKDSFKVTVEAGLNLGLFSFSSSASYGEIHKSTAVEKQTVTFVQSRFEFCGLELREDFDSNTDTARNLGLDSTFVAAVKNLKQKADCARFIKTFGTHYAREVIFGGRMYQSIHISEDAKTELEKKSKDLKVSAGFTFKKASASIAAGTSSEQTSSLETKKGLTVEDIRWVGGTPSTNFNEWVKSVREDPKPMHLSLEPLYSLFTETRFPQSSIEEKKQWMKEAVSAYLTQETVAVPEPASVDLKDLNNKTFALINRLGADSNAPRVDQQFGLQGGSQPRLISGTEKKYAWKLTLDAGRTDEFHIQLVQSFDADSKRYVGNVLGFYTSKNLTVDDLKMPFPWKLVRAPGKTDEYYLQCATDAKGSEVLWAGVGFDDDGLLELFAHGDDTKVVPWRLVPSPQ